MPFYQNTGTLTKNDKAMPEVLDMMLTFEQKSCSMWKAVVSKHENSENGDRYVLDSPFHADRCGRGTIYLWKHIVEVM